MKKLLALALAIVMMMAIALPTFAAAAVADTTQSTRYGDGNDDSSKDNYLVDANDAESKDVLIKYGVAQAYTVTIPEAINLHQQIAAATNKTIGWVYSIQPVSVEDVVIAGDEFLNIYLASKETTNGRRTWILTDDEGTKSSANVDYAVRTDKYLDETSVSGVVSGITDGGAILVCAPQTGNKGTTGSTASTELYFSSKGTAQEGTFTDVLTFKVAIEKTAATIENDKSVVADPDVQG